MATKPATIQQAPAHQVEEGFFTVVGHYQDYTFRIQRQDADARFASGQLIIGLLIGPHNESDYKDFGFVTDNGLLKVWGKRHPGERVVNAAKFLLSGDHVAAGKQYAFKSGNCWKCNRMLTTKESKAAGIGPKCASKLGA